MIAFPHVSTTPSPTNAQAAPLSSQGHHTLLVRAHTRLRPHPDHRPRSERILASVGERDTSVSTANLVPIHKHLIDLIATQSSIDLWNLTAPANPVAMVAFGSPTIDDNAGYIMVAALAPTVLHAADWIIRTLSDPKVTVLCPGFVPPVRHTFVFEFLSFTSLSVVGWSNIGLTTHGIVTKPPHPEFPTDVDLLPFASMPPLLSRPTFNATILRQLEHLDELFPQLLS